jgi:hypothetical protein
VSNSVIVRIRRRRLTGRYGYGASTSYNLLLAERTAGKVRHRFVGGLGSLKEPVKDASEITRFWLTAFFRMKRHGLDERERLHVASEMVRKGARALTA